MGPWHIGLSIVATDVGGGFSIGLGGLGFVMGLSGSWLLFTGFLGAWLSAVFIIPKIKKIDRVNKFLTYPDFLRFRYNNKVATVAAVISGLGYLGFTSAQILAGVTLSSNTIFSDIPTDIDPATLAFIVIGFIIIGYTVLGGIKAVIITDTYQWIILLTGLIVFAIPITIYETGGISEFVSKLPDEFFRLDNVSVVQFFNWMITTIPIWLIAMTLYQRMYATKDVKEAKKAWYIAGFMEYPIMAFAGVFLGMSARIFFPEAEAESGLPLLLKEILPIGVKGIVIAAYFSAIMSTADSCLIASSGNLVNDILEKFAGMKKISFIRLSQVSTLLIGIISILLASYFTNVLDIILYAYSFMVGGLFIPTLMAYFKKKVNSGAAIYSMIAGGISTIALIILAEQKIIELPFGLDPVFFGIAISLITYFVAEKIKKD